MLFPNYNHKGGNIMSKKDLSVTIRNMTVKQYEWLESESKRTGQTFSAIFKAWIQVNIDNQQR